MFQQFSGSSRRARNVNLSGQRGSLGGTRGWRPPSGDAVSQSVSNAQAEREQRRLERRKQKAAEDIQRVWRGHVTRSKLCLARREVFDELYKHQGQGGDVAGRLRAALPLLLFFYSRRIPEDQNRLLLFCDDVEARNFNDLPEHRLRLAPLARILIDRLEASLSERSSDSSTSIDVRDSVLRFLNQITALAPRALIPYLGSYYGIMARLCRDYRSLDSLTKAILLPLSASPSPDNSDPAYRAFTLRFLAQPDLTLIDNNAGYFLQRMDGERLALAITKASSTGEPSESGGDSRLYLLAHLIALGTSRGAFATQPSLLSALHKQISSLQSEIKARFPLNKTDGLKQDHPKSSKPLNPPLPPYVRDKLLSLVDSEGISTLFQAYEILDQEGPNRTASILSSYILVLFRCFPQISDEIRMRLYLQDVQLKGRNVPYIVSLWKLVSETSVFVAILQDHSSPVKYVREYLAKSDGPSEKTTRQELDLILFFLQLYIFILRFCDDEDFFGGMNQNMVSNRPMSRLQSCSLGKEDVERLSLFLKSVCFAMYYNAHAMTSQIELTTSPAGDGAAGTSRGTSDGLEKSDFEGMRTIMSTAMRMLYERDSRRRFLPLGHWLLSSFTMDAFIKDVVAEEQRDYDVEGAGDEGSDAENMSDVEELLNPYDSSLHGGSRLVRWGRWEREQSKRQKESRMAIVGPRKAILRNMPFVIPFETRVRIFRQFIYLDKVRRRHGATDADEWRMRQMMVEDDGPGHNQLGKHRATIKRGQLFQDAFDQFWGLGEGLKEPIEITFVDRFDTVEAGIDGGGVTKEFLTSITTEMFRKTETTDQGPPLFTSNTQGLLYPNPTALDEMEMLMEDAGLGRSTQQGREVFYDYLRTFEFMGRIVGKCMYEGILIDFSFANFFLLKWALGHQGASSYKGSINDLRDLDEEMYQGLLRVKNYPGNVEDMALDFTINDRVASAWGRVSTRTKHLVSHGSSVPVTNENRLLYISYVARHRLVAQAEIQTAAFLRGLRTIIHPSWLSMFNQTELQRLVGGDSRALNVEDLRANTEYGGLYVIGDDNEEHPTVKMFWEVMEEFGETDQRDVLKYVTSTPRAPLLGFSQLQPRFTIRDSGGPERLPSASTCLNMLKLPRYRDKETLRKKLQLAVSSGAGFDMS